MYDDIPGFGPNALPGDPARSRPGAPYDTGFLLDHLGGGFMLLGLNTDVLANSEFAGLPVAGQTVTADAALSDCYLDDTPQAVSLIRPDQHVMVRWQACAPITIKATMLER